jgi:hypothetical protein
MKGKMFRYKFPRKGKEGMEMTVKVVWEGETRPIGEQTRRDDSCNLQRREWKTHSFGCHQSLEWEESVVQQCLDRCFKY